jgi:hypothetical protein
VLSTLRCWEKSIPFSSWRNDAAPELFHSRVKACSKAWT